MRKKNILRQIGVVTALILFSLISWGATKSLAQTVTLTVNFTYGIPKCDPADNNGKSSGVGNYVYNDGAGVTCSIVSPVYGDLGVRYVCIGWTGEGSVSPPSGAGTSVGFSITENSTITWFWQTQYQLTTTVNPSGAGTITPATGFWYKADDTIVINATPKAGYIFVEWSGDFSGSITPNDLLMNEPKSVTANFEEEPKILLSVTSTHTTIYSSWTTPTGTPIPTPNILELYRAIYKNGVLGDYTKHTLLPSATFYQDTAYPPESGTTNYEDRIFYYVVAYYSEETITSNIVNEMLIPFPPEKKPTNLDAVTSLGGVVSLSWDDNSEDETGFYIERKKKGPDHSYAWVGTATAGSTNYEDRTITGGESYYYRIKAYKTYPDTENTKAAKCSNEAFIDTLPPIGSTEGGGSGCFIATAAYGTPMAKEVRSLCEFRDNVLLKTTVGKSFVEFYYKTSPPIAEFIRNKPILKAMLRVGLKPLVWFSKAVTNKD